MTMISTFFTHELAKQIGFHKESYVSHIEHYKSNYFKLCSDRRDITIIHIEYVQLKIMH